MKIVKGFRCKLNPHSTAISHRRVGLSGENSEPKYANFLCFIVSVQTNKLMSKRGGVGYSKFQKKSHDLIKSLHKSGLGYPRIAYHLNAKNLKTYTGKEWKGNHVYATLKRYKEREQKLTLKQEVFKPEISKFEVWRERV